MHLAARASLTLLLACAGDLPKPGYVSQPSAALVSVPYPPPPARVEFVPERPVTAGAVWIDGEWVWQARHWAWRPGRWVAPPAGARFSPWSVVHGEDGTTYHAPGGWRDALGADLAEPTALATAKVSPGEVIDAEGEHEATGRTIRPDQVGGDAGRSARTAVDRSGGGIGITDAASPLRGNSADLGD